MSVSPWLYARVFLSGLLVLSMPSVRAGSPPPASGIVVSIRGDILEIQPAWLTGHQRLMVDKKTSVVEELIPPLSKTPIGTRVVIFGRGDLKSGLTAFYIIAGDLKSQGFGGKLVGVMNSQWGIYYGGVLKSADPLIVTDDNGTDIRTAMVHARGVHYTRVASIDDVLIGGKITYNSDRTTGGIRHVTDISISSTPGKPGVLFATVVSAGGGKLTVVPRFGSTPADVMVSPSCPVQRQITLDGDTIKLGDTVSAWGIPVQGRGMGLVAYALMRGVKTFPIVSTSADASDKSVTGFVKSLSPFTLAVTGKPLPIYVTGQTPLVDFAPSSVGHLRKGDMVMLLVAKRPQGGMMATYILVDASPILAFAFAD